MSNTSDASLCAVTKVQGESPRKEASLAIDLAPHETRVVDVKTGILQRERGAMSQFGSISIEHNGAAGAVLARALAFESMVGYSLPVQFSNPAGAKSNNLQGAGLRLADVRDDRLSAKVVLHNASQAEMIAIGRVPYTTTDGIAGELYLPQQQLSAGETEVIDVTQLLKIQGGRRNDVSAAGLELQHTGDLGALITSSFSVSESGNQVFRMPIWDVAAQRSATGGYPWYTDGNSSTLVYIKNTTDQQRQFRLYLMFEGGAYLYPLTAVAPHQTHTIDIRALRDDQVPDADGKTIPLATTRGQVQWSMTGGEDRVFVGRSEQADLVKRISSNYSCINCCGNSFYDGWLTPGSTSGFEGDEMQITAMQQDMNCYGQTFSPYPAWAVFNAAAPFICDTTSFGSMTLVAPGQTSIYGDWTVDSWFSGTGGYCEYTPMKILRDALCQTLESPDHLLVISDTTEAWCTGGPPGSTSLQRRITYQVVDRFNVPVTIPLSIAERFIALNDHTCGAGAPSPSACRVMLNGQFTDTLMAGCTPFGGSCGYDVIKQIEFCRTLAVPKPLGLTNEQVHANQITVNGNSTSLQGTYIYP